MRGGALAVCVCLLGCGPAPSTTAAPDAGSDAASSTGCGRLATCGATCVDLLTDDANCGGCGLACSTGCKAGRCVEELAFATVNEMATDGMHVFWSSGAIYPQSCGFPPCSALNAVSVAGGPTTPIFVADPDAIAAGPVIDGKNAYFILAHGNGSASLSSTPLSGGTPSTIRSGALGGPMGFGGGQVFFIEWPEAHQMALGSWSPTKATSSRLSLGDSTWAWVTSIAADDTGPYWLTAGEASPVTSLDHALLDALTDASLPGGYFIETSEGFTMALDDAYVFTKSPTAIQRIARDTGTMTTIATTAIVTSGSVPTRQPIVADGAYVYFSDDAAQTLCKVPRDGGAATVLAHTRYGGVRSIVVDAESVYWADLDTIMKVTPK